MKKTFLIVALGLSLIGQLEAQIIFQDNFSTYNAAALNNQATWTNNSSSAGLGACAGAICSGAQIANRNMSYTDYTSSTKAVTILSDADSCGTFFPAVQSGDVYFSFLINLSATPTTTSTNDIIRVASASNFNTTFRVFFKTASSGSYYIGVTKGATGNPAVFSPNGYNMNQDHLVVIKYSQGAGASDYTITVYVYPVLSLPEPTANPAFANFTGTDQAGSIDRIVIRQNASNLPTGFFSCLKIARTWNDLNTLSTQMFESKTIQLSHYDLTQGQLSFDSTQLISQAEVSIYDLKGAKLVAKTIEIDGQTTMSIPAISVSGVYVLEVKQQGQSVLNQKLVVK